MVIVSKLERIECMYNHWISLASYSLVHVTCLSKKMAITESGIVYYRSNDVRHLLFQSNLVNCRMNERICVVVRIKALYVFILKLCTSYIFCVLQVLLWKKKKWNVKLTSNLEKKMQSLKNIQTYTFIQQTTFLIHTVPPCSRFDYFLSLFGAQRQS